MLSALSLAALISGWIMHAEMRDQSLLPPPFTMVVVRLLPPCRGVVGRQRQRVHGVGQCRMGGGSGVIRGREQQHQLVDSRAQPYLDVDVPRQLTLQFPHAQKKPLGCKLPLQLPHAVEQLDIINGGLLATVAVQRMMMVVAVMKQYLNAVGGGVMAGVGVKQQQQLLLLGMLRRRLLPLGRHRLVAGP
jgi:hypothetical protein